MRGTTLSAPDRLSDEELKTLRENLAASGLQVAQRCADADAKLAKLRSLYEPYVQGIARNLLITLPPWIHSEKKRDNWQGGPWDKSHSGQGTGGTCDVVDEHF